ncbi:hypothetical protein TNCT_540541 [Trichonephila clavata]|uniref:Uncharacterized protein n=1 Tax=Trichonephila clavata TaxID=2740835 RepID=A0A8X6H7Y7_TRICU|nr:hypothetical protein TNCT_540541 [Trichonephila clavata]
MGTDTIECLRGSISNHQIPLVSSKSALMQLMGVETTKKDSAAIGTFYLSDEVNIHLHNLEQSEVTSFTKTGRSISHMSSSYRETLRGRASCGVV